MVGYFPALLGYAPPVPPCPPCPPFPPPALIPATSPNPLLGVGPSTADFGQDFSFLTQLDPNLTLVGGIANLAQQLIHRLETPRGGLFYDLDYGTDVRALLNTAITPAKLSKCNSDVQRELTKDERVLSCTANTVFVPATSSLQISINIATNSGPFSFVLSVTQVSVQLLAPPVVSS
jgi:phage baseplate assembly protein W